MENDHGKDNSSEVPVVKPKTSTGNSISSGEEEQNLRKKGKAENFQKMYDRLIRSIVQKDEISFNEFISPRYGLFIIGSKGAMPDMVNVKNMAAFKRSDGGKILLEFESADLDCKLLEEELPVADCDSPKDFYNKNGCFTQAVNSFIESKIWEYCNLTPENIKITSQAAATITRTVINTSAFRCYFSEIDGKLYLTFIDLRIPCTA